MSNKQCRTLDDDNIEMAENYIIVNHYEIKITAFSKRISIKTTKMLIILKSGYSRLMISYFDSTIKHLQSTF